MSVLTSLVTRADSWINAMTGLGTLRDKLVYTQPVAGAKLGDGALESLFNDDDIARRICAKLPREAMRRGFHIELEGDDESEDADDIGRLMDDQLMLLGAIPKLRDSWIWARLYGGGCGVFVGADDGQSPEQPLNEEGIRTISFLNVVKRPLITIKSRYEDVTSPQFGEPELYSVHVASTGLGPVVARASIDIHASRMILFEGAMTAQQTFQSPSGWQDSVLQNVYSALQQSATAWQSVAHLMTDASQGVLKIANLVDLIASGGQDALRTRIQMMDMARSVARAILVDAEKESFERVSTSFAGLPEVMDKLMMRVAAAAEQPVTLLFGRSPAGMNATGESDIRGWYDTVSDAQTDILKPRLERLLRLMFAAKDSPTNGRVPERWCVEFNPLWQPTDKETADTQKVVADTYVALVGAGIMTDAEAGIGLAPDFPTIDVGHREDLMAADLEEGLRPSEINTPTPPLDPNDPAANGGEGGSKGDSPKARTDAEQPRKPKGSAEGGQFASKGGAALSEGGWGKTEHSVKQAVASLPAHVDSVKSASNADIDAASDKAYAAYTPEQAKAVGRWSGPSYGEIRKADAGVPSVDPRFHELASHLRGAIEEHGITTDGAVHRGLKVSHDVARQMLNSPTIDMDSMTSWTSDEATYRHFSGSPRSSEVGVVLTMNNARGLPLGGKEAELIVPKGQYRIANRTVDSHGTLRIQLAATGSDKPKATHDSVKQAIAHLPEHQDHPRSAAVSTEKIDAAARKARSTFTQDDRDVVEEWMGGRYAAIRAADQGEDAKPEFKAAAERMNNLMAAHEYEAAGVSYRGYAVPPDIAHKLLSQDQLRLASLTSWSGSESTARSFARRNVPAQHTTVILSMHKARGLPIGGDEAEMVVPKNGYKVVSRSRDDKGILRVHIEPIDAATRKAPVHRDSAAEAEPTQTGDDKPTSDDKSRFGSNGEELQFPDVRDDGWDTQTRAPKGSSIGGRWVSKGGGGTAAQKKEARAKLTDVERESIRAGVKSGSLLVEYQRRIVEKYGPGKGGMIAYERDIKARMKEAKAARGQIREAKKREKDIAENIRLEKEKLEKAKQEAAHKAKAEAEARAKAEAATKARAEAEAKAGADAAAKARLAEKKAKSAEKAKVTRAANKAKKEAEAKARKEAEAKEEADAKAASTKSIGATSGLPPEHTVEHHAAQLEEEYGFAAATVGWGRAMRERGKALSLDDFSTGVDGLHGLGIEHADPRETHRIVGRLARTGRYKTVGELTDGLRAALVDAEVVAHVEVASQLVAHRRALADAGATTGALAFKHEIVNSSGVATKEIAKVRDDVATLYAGLSHKDVKQPTGYFFEADSKNDRAYHSERGGGLINLGVGSRTVEQVHQAKWETAHEWGHAIEHLNHKRAMRSGRFLEARTKGELASSLAELTGNSAFDFTEVARKDKFFDPYVGKIYPPKGSAATATEVLSMGAQHLVNLKDMARRVYTSDPETFHFTLGQLANQ